MKKNVLLFLLISFFVFTVVEAKNTEMELTGNSILNGYPTSADKSVQSMSISYDSTRAFVFITSRSNPISDAVSVDFYTRNSTSDEFSLSGRVSALSYDDNSVTRYVEHANGSTYFKKGNQEFLLVTTKVNGKSAKYVLKYLISNNTLTFVEKFYVPFAVVGVTYDRSEDAFYVAGAAQVWKYSSDFKNSFLIRKEGTGSAIPGGTIGYFYEDQDITYFNGHLYYVSYVAEGNVETFRRNTGLNLRVGDSIITVINAKTGDFVKFLIFNYDDVSSYIKYKGYHTANTLKEIEEIVFINNEPYIFFQNRGTCVLIKARTIPGSVGIFDYTKLYIRYNMNGGYLSTSNNLISSYRDSILISGSDLVESGSLGGMLSVNGLANYNNNTYINVIRDGYHVNVSKEWIDNNHRVFSQTIQYKVSDLADVVNNDKIIDLYVNWIPNTYRISFDANGGIGYMNSMNMIYDVTASLNKNLFSNSTAFVEWNTKSDGTGVSYKNQQNVKKLVTSNGGEIRLYAIWKKSNATIDTPKVDTNLDDSTVNNSDEKNVDFGKSDENDSNKDTVIIDKETNESKKNTDIKKKKSNIDSKDNFDSLEQNNDDDELEETNGDISQDDDELEETNGDISQDDDELKENIENDHKNVREDLEKNEENDTKDNDEKLDRTNKWEILGLISAVVVLLSAFIFFVVNRRKKISNI